VDGSKERDTINAIVGSDQNAFCLSSSPGWGKQMNCGAKASKSDILLFLHADTLLPPHAFTLIISVLADPKIAGGAFSLGIHPPSRKLNLITKLTTIRSRFTRIPYGDQAIFIRREVFEQLGGFREIPIMEDLDFMRRLRRSGYRIRILRNRVTTSRRRWEREGICYCTLRNWYIKARFLLGTSPDKLAEYYPPDQDKE